MVCDMGYNLSIPPYRPSSLARVIGGEGCNKINIQSNKKRKTEMTGLFAVIGAVMVYFANKA